MVTPQAAAKSGPSHQGCCHCQCPAGLSGWEDRWSARRRDALNLAALLGVLDGVVDTPGRLVITDHQPP